MRTVSRRQACHRESLFLSLLFISLYLHHASFSSTSPPHSTVALTIPSPSSHSPFTRTHTALLVIIFRKMIWCFFSALLDRAQGREPVKLRRGRTTGLKLVMYLWHCGYMVCNLASWAAEWTAHLFTTGSLTPTRKHSDDLNPGEVLYPSLMFPFKCMSQVRGAITDKESSRRIFKASSGMGCWFSDHIIPKITK